MKLGMQKKSILKILGENDQNITLRKIWGGSSGFDISCTPKILVASVAQ